VTTFLYLVALFLLLTLTASIYRIVRGPDRADRMLAGQIFGTTGVAVLLLLSAATDRPAIVDAALVFALLAVVNTTVFVHQAWRSGPE
jgi:multicomponent Na+:H+ antiporter subunit F